MSVPLDHPLREQLRQTGEWLIKLSQIEDATSASTLLGASLPQPNPVHLRYGRSDEPLFIWLAAEEYNERARRRQCLDADLFGEPSWDILLDLYCAQAAGRKISVTSACIASQVPPTTALRWLDELAKRELIVREPDEHDKRRNWVTLSDKARRLMTNYFQERAQRRVGPHVGIGGAGLIRKS